MRFIFVFLIFFLLFSSASAITSQEAKNFVVSESHYLEPNESIEISPNYPVSYQGKEYWVLTVLYDDSPSGFIAVKQAEKAIELNPAINRELFKTAYIFRSLGDYKKRFEQQWLFTLSNARFFESLAGYLGNESFELSTVNEKLSDAEAKQTLQVMNSLLDEMGSNSSVLEGSINEAAGKEAEFFANADANSSAILRTKYEKVFSEINELDNMRIEYTGYVTQIKKSISESGLEVDEIRTLLALVDSPSSLSKVESMNSAAKNLKQGIDSIYSSAASSSSNWVDNVQVKKERNDAWVSLYGEDKDFYAKTKDAWQQGFNSLKAAVDYIFSEQLKPYWKNAEKLSELELNWGKAEKAFNAGDYSEAMDYSSKAKTNAVAVLRDNLEQNDDELLKERAIQIVIVLIILLIIAFIIRNRGKFVSAWKSGSQKEEDVGLNEWKNP